MDRVWTQTPLFAPSIQKKMDWGIIRDATAPQTRIVSLQVAGTKTKSGSASNSGLSESRTPWPRQPMVNKKKRNEGIRAWIASHTSSVLARAKRSIPLPTGKICCKNHYIPQSAPGSHTLSIFLQGLRIMLASSLCPPTIFYPYPLSRALPTTIIELETIKKDQSHTRYFSHAYFALLPVRDEKKREMYPEESFGAVSVARVEEGIRGERAREKLTVEWIKRDEIVSERMFWRCANCECGYWVRSVDIADTAGDWRDGEDSVVDDTWAIVSEVRTQESHNDDPLSEFLDIRH